MSDEVERLHAELESLKSLYKVSQEAMTSQSIYVSRVFLVVSAAQVYHRACETFSNIHSGPALLDAARDVCAAERDLFSALAELEEGKQA